jgi:hypothetical protein
MSLTIKQRIVNMRMSGASYEDIQQELKCDMQSIAYHLNKDSKVNVSKKIRKEHGTELEAIQAYKERMGCIDCANEYPHYVLEFDHLPEFKKFGQVSHVLKKYGPDKAWEEIAKCDVVCSNCHKLRTNERIFAKERAILDS